MLIEVLNKDVHGNSRMQIGKGMFRFDSFNRDIFQIDVNLTHIGKRSQLMQGRVSLKAAMKKISVIRNRPMVLKLSDLLAKEMVNTGTMFDGQDPCLQIEINSQIYMTSR